MFETRVYFARCLGPTGEPIGAYKIGCTHAPEDRIRQIGSGLPITLELIAAVPGGRVLEKICHISLKEHRISGEYFHASERVEDLASGAAQSGFIFNRIRDTGMDPAPDGAVKAFLEYHDVSLGDACEMLGFKLSQYEKLIQKPRFRSSNVVAAAAVVASRKGHAVHWPYDAIRGLCGSFAPQLKRPDVVPKAEAA